MYEIWIQYIAVFKRYRPETIFHSEIKGHNSDNNWWILSIIELDLYFMIMYLCIKYESNTPMFSKDIARKPFFVRTGQDVRDVRTYGQGWCYMPPHYKWRGHKNQSTMCFSNLHRRNYCPVNKDAVAVRRSDWSTAKWDHAYRRLDILWQTLGHGLAAIFWSFVTEAKFGLPLSSSGVFKEFETRVSRKKLGVN